MKFSGLTTSSVQRSCGFLPNRLSGIESEAMLPSHQFWVKYQSGIFYKPLISLVSASGLEPETC